MSEAETAKLRDLARAVDTAWVDEVTKSGKDGAALLAAAEALIVKHGR